MPKNDSELPSQVFEASTFVNRFKSKKWKTAIAVYTCYTWKFECNRNS